MKKLAFSVVALLVAGAGASVSAAGCSSSSSSGNGGPAADTGTVEDVTNNQDTGTEVDSGTATDTGSPTPEAGCSTDAGGSFQFPGADGGENTTCEACIATNCGMQQTACLDDCNMVNPDDAGNIPACGGYVSCLYTAAETYLAQNPDAGLAGLSGQLSTFEGTCGTGLPSASTTLGNLFVACAANPSTCAGECF
jgi:hypothetical protein